MADAKTSALPAVASVVDAQEFPVNDGGTSKKATAAQVRTYVLAAITQLDVDNLRLDGNTLSSTAGAVVIAPTTVLTLPGGTAVNGSGDITLATGSVVNNADWFRAVNAGTAKVALNRGSGTVSAGLALASDRSIVVSGTTDSEGSADTEQKRDSAGTWVDLNGANGLGKRLTGRPVEASTAGSGAPNLLASTESRKLLTNEGATAEAYNTLPAAAAGVEFLFYCQDGDGIRVVAGAGDTIRIGATESAAAGFVRSSTIGSSLQLIAINATEWVAVFSSGTWTVDA